MFNFKNSFFSFSVTLLLFFIYLCMFISLLYLLYYTLDNVACLYIFYYYFHFIKRKLLISCNYLRETQQFYLNVAIWLSKMDALNDVNAEKSFKNADLLLKGVDYANEIHNLYTVLTNTSANMSKIMTKSSVLSLCHLIELLKAIQMQYHKKKEFMAFAIQFILQELSLKLLNIIQAARVINNISL